MIRLEAPLMILVSFAMLLVALDGCVTRLEGLILYRIGTDCADPARR
jgi:hypothetical protein